MGAQALTPDPEPRASSSDDIASTPAEPSTSPSRLEAWLRLTHCEGLSPRLLHALLREFEAPEPVLDASAAMLSRIVSADVARAIRSSRSAPGGMVDAALAWSASPGNHLLAWDDPRYPQALLELPDPPPLLYCTGNPARLNGRALAMVGSRSSSPGGVQTAEEFAAAFASAGIDVVSGMALGIDAAAHRGALAGAGADRQAGTAAAGTSGPASTVAVVGTGIDRVYPARNRDLAHSIAERGAIVSEFPLGTPPLAHNFPRRNRLISGLARGVLVVEARLNSGSLITARFAAEQGKEVFAIPGSIHSPFSKGCHRLIKDGAKLVETAQDVLEELRWPAPVAGLAPEPARPHPAGGEDERRLLDALGFDPVTADVAVERTGFPVDRVLSMLLHLELGGSIVRLPGDRVQRLR